MSVNDRINTFIKYLDQMMVNHWKEMQFTFAEPPTHLAQYMSKKWCRIVTVKDEVPGSVYAFVCLQEGTTKTLGHVEVGQIFKPANYNAPAKHARGSVFSEDFDNCAMPNGIVYLR